MAGVTLDSDAAQVAAALVAAGAELLDLAPVNSKAGAIVASASAPRRTGRLAASVQSDASRTGTVVGSPLRYALPVHWGLRSRNMAAQPWLMDKLVAATNTITDLYADHAAKVIRSL